jgi:hypothetical protein
MSSRQGSNKDVNRASGEEENEKKMSVAEIDEMVSSRLGLVY